MHRRRFNELMKRRVSPYLFLATGVGAAQTRGVHPEALMVFERDLTGYPVFVCALTQADGYSPREPLERDIAWLHSMDMDRVARGRKGWVDDVSAREMEEQDKETARQQAAIDEIFGEEVVPRAKWKTHHERVYASSVIPPASQGAGDA